MKILFSSYHNPHFLTISEYIEKAIIRLRHSLISFEDRAFIIPGRIRQGVKALQEWDLKRLNHKMTSLAVQKKPDFCLVAGGQRLLPETVERIRKMRIKTALWTVDIPSDFQPILDAARYYDFIFCGGTEAQEILEKTGIPAHFLPFACDPEIHRKAELTPEEKREWGSDVTFVGSFYPNRAQILEKISDFDLKVWGPGWNKLAPASTLQKFAKDRGLRPEEWTKILSSSKITLAIHYQDEKIPCYQASPKVYETLACRAFLLVDAQKDVQTLFEDGKHLVIFKNLEDLREKIDYYLHHKEERERIASLGYEEVIQKHTYIHRVRQILSVCELEDNGKKK